MYLFDLLNFIERSKTDMITKIVKNPNTLCKKSQHLEGVFSLNTGIL